MSLNRPQRGRLTIAEYMLAVAAVAIAIVVPPLGPGVVSGLVTGLLILICYRLDSHMA